jgi:proteasome accessory factor A
MSEVATYLKVGTTAIVLAMIEDDVLGSELALGNPVAAIRQVSHDPTLTRTIMLRNGSRMTALELQWALLERAQKYERSHGLGAVGDEVGAEVLGWWELVLSRLEHDPVDAADVVDWVAKRRLVEGYAERHGLRAADPRLKAIDLQYHDLREGRGLAERVGLQRLVEPAEVVTAMTEPPRTTRAYFRGRCLQRWPDEIVAANWDSMVFDVGRDPLRRVPMMEPLRGTAAMVGRLIDECDTAAELVARLEA